MIAADPDEAARIAPEVSRRFAGRLRAATSLPHFVEINAAAVSKAAALEWVRTELVGASADRTVACGDGLNDVDMLRWAALGVAIAEGAEGAREAALVVSRAELGELFERLAVAPAGPLRLRRREQPRSGADEAKAAPGGRTPPSRGLGRHGGLAPTVRSP